MLRRHFLTVGILAWLAGCAAPPISLTQRALASIDSAESVLLIPKATLSVSVDPTYIGGGLLDQLLANYIDSKRQESAAAAATSVIQIAQDYDFRSAMRDAWTSEFSKITAVKFKAPARVEAYGAQAEDAKARKRADYDRSDAAAVLFVDIDYSLRSGTLVITAKTEVYPKSPKLAVFRPSPKDADPMDDGNVIYRKEFSHKKEFITANNIRRAMDEGVIEVARKVAGDIAVAQP
jgi:hypothetical protein